MSVETELFQVIPELVLNTHRYWELKEQVKTYCSRSETMMVIKESDTVHVRIGKEAHDKHKELVKRKYDGKTKTFTLFELTRAVKSHCKTLEKELEQKENED